MKRIIKAPVTHLFSRPLLITGLGLLLAAPVAAQTYSVLRALDDYADGASPIQLILSGNVLYGATRNGGRFTEGTVFRVNTDGTSFTNLYNFTGFGDGGGPYCELALSNDTLYGTTDYGGLFWGTIFRLKTDGTDFSAVYSYQRTGSGNHPHSGVLILDNSLYGVTQFGGDSSNSGTVYRVNTDGTLFTNLHIFSISYGEASLPSASLLISGNTLFGTTSEGGTSGIHGAVFKINTDGTGYSILHSFAGGSDGSSPRAPLILSGNALYGTTYGFDGLGTKGSIFKMNTDGTGFSTLHVFAGLDGVSPQGALLLLGNALYGTTSAGGTWNAGTIFKVNPDGTGFTNLYHFTGGGDGGAPLGGLVAGGNVLYGTASTGGGTRQAGTLFALTLPAVKPISLNAALMGGQLVLTWGDAAFALQAAPSLTAGWTNVAQATSPFTNGVSNGKGFFRLIKSP